MFKRILAGILLMLSLTTVAHTQDAIPPFAAVTGHTLSIYGLSAEPMPVSSPDNQGITDLAWSPDGNKVAYMLLDSSFQSKLMVADAASGQSFELEVGPLEGGFPISFTPEGKILFVGQGSLNGTATYQSILQQIAPEMGAMPETLTPFAMQTGCGGGSSLPGDWGYWDDAGFGGNHLLLAMTNFGVIHSTTCTGVGLALLNLQTGQDTPVELDAVHPQSGSTGFSRAELSPDGNQLAALYTSNTDSAVSHSLAVIDLATLNVTNITTTAQPNQLAWGAEDTIFYSVVTPVANLADSLSPEQKQAFGGGDTLNIPSNYVQIRQVNPASANDELLYETDAYAIGRMEATPDGTTLVFSQVANMDAWVKALADGSIDIIHDPNGEAQRALVPVSLIQLTLATGEVTRLGDNLTHFALQPTVM